MQQILSHLFLPHTSNNHRPKILHHSSILLFIVAFLLSQFFISYLKVDYPAVLGSSINLSTEQLVTLTNREREKQQLSPLQMSDVLSKAAGMKADYMFAENFWAHDGPDGTTPWYFFKKVGYNYTYAGENLARGFTDSEEVMTAWIDSPTHRENILSPNYNEVGFAIKKGELLGEETTLIVEMFGSTNTTPLADVPNDQTMQVLPAAIDAKQVFPKKELSKNSEYSYVLKTTSLISSKILSSSIALFMLTTFIFILFLDMILIQRKKITRVVGHNLDHIFFFGAFLLIVLLSTKGMVL